MTSKDLVNRSAGLSTPAMWKGSMTLYLYCSQIKWCQILMCLVWCLTARFTMRNIVAWLSKHSGIGPSMGNPISPLKDLSHAACCPVLASSMYLASPTDNVTIFCHWNAEDIAPLPSRKCVLMWSDDHLCFHPNLSLNIQVTQHLMICLGCNKD